MSLRRGVQGLVPRGAAAARAATAQTPPQLRVLALKAQVKAHGFHHSHLLCQTVEMNSGCAPSASAREPAPLWGKSAALLRAGVWNIEKERTGALSPWT